MRKFVTNCIDDITGMTMVLSECSYNMACDYLMRSIGQPISVKLVNNMAEIKYPKITFYYDENRGYLLKGGN